MGTSRSAAEFVGKINRAGDAFRKAERDALSEAAFAGKKIIEGSIRSVVPDMRMSMGGRNAKVGVRYDIKGTSKPTALMRATGPLHLVENDTSPRVIPKERKRRRGARKTLLLPDGGLRRSVKHPGTKGQQPFAEGRKAAEPVMTKMIRSRYLKVARGVFG